METGKVIPIGQQEYAYQCENVDTICKIRGHPPCYSGGKQPYPNEEVQEVRLYEIEILKFTSNALTVNLKKIYHNGDVKTYQFGCSFAQLANILFENTEYQVFENI